LFIASEKSAVNEQVGSGLVFCFSQKSHANALNFHVSDESRMDIPYLQGKILPRSPAHF